MNTCLNFIRIVTLAGALLFLIYCEAENPVNEGLSDAQKVQALKRVTLDYDSLEFLLTFPSDYKTVGAFSELSAADSSIFYNLDNYEISMGLHLTADNTHEDAEDAKFDGMVINTVFHTHTGFPLALDADGFEVRKNSKKSVAAEGTLNLETHKLPGKYILTQMAEGDPITVTMTPVLHYKIGALEGDIELPEMQQDVPTRASDDTKTFLRNLLDAGVLD